ncbi:MAG: hypothetical protein EPN97_15745 [Alphaproteobacteria bacterium]|nr:MAG: hypothetical protein EPN97_15745 [Alphaproteobacteria bacterium]
MIDKDNINEIIVCGASDLLEEVAEEEPAAVLSMEHPGVSPGEPGHAPRLAESGFDDVPQLILTFWDSEQKVPNGPDRAQVQKGLDFVMDHIKDGAVVIHCKAGKSRSAAMALGVLSKLHPEKPETELVEMLLAIRPQAAPNILMVEMLDDMTGRGGKLVKAVLDHPVVSAQRAQAEENRRSLAREKPELYRKMFPEKFFKP